MANRLGVGNLVKADEKVSQTELSMKSGDYVTLLSGGPLMMVVDIRDGVVTTEWPEGVELERGIFPKAILVVQKERPVSKKQSNRPAERVKECEVCGADVYRVKEGGEVVWMAQCGSEHLEIQRHDESRVNTTSEAR